MEGILGAPLAAHLVHKRYQLAGQIRGAAGVRASSGAVTSRARRSARRPSSGSRRRWARSTSSYEPAAGMCMRDSR